MIFGYGGTANDPNSKLVNEHDDNDQSKPSYFTLGVRSKVAYGRDSKFTYKTLEAGKYECGNSVFTDPYPGVRKACYLIETYPTNVGAPSPADAQIAYLLRRWAYHKLVEVPLVDRQRLQKYFRLARESGAQFPRGSPISPIVLRPMLTYNPTPGYEITLVRRDAGERHANTEFDAVMYTDDRYGAYTLVPVRTEYQEDWGTFGIQGFHLENQLAAVGTIVGSVAGTIVPGVGNAVGAAIGGALGKAASNMLGTKAQAQTGQAAQGVVVGTVPDLLKLSPEDLLYTPAGVPISPSTGQPVPPAQIQTPSGQQSKMILWGIAAAVVLGLVVASRK